MLGVGSIDERDMLLEADPTVFHLTDHYKSYPYILVRIAEIDAASLRAMLHKRWLEICPRKLKDRPRVPAAKTKRSAAKNKKTR